MKIRNNYSLESWHQNWCFSSKSCCIFQKGPRYADIVGTFPPLPFIGLFHFSSTCQGKHLICKHSLRITVGLLVSHTVLQDFFYLQRYSTETLFFRFHSHRKRHTNKDKFYVLQNCKFTEAKKIPVNLHEA